MATRTIDTVLFDLDGTLINSIDFILECFRYAFTVNGLTPKPDAFWMETIGRPIREQMADSDTHPEMWDRVLGTYREYNSTHHDQRVTVYPGIPELMASLAADDFSIGVVTSKSRAGAERGLAVTQLRQYVHVIVSADDVTRGKPHPEPVLTAVGLCDAEPARTIFLGDSVHDMVAGRAAGVRTAAALWGPFDRNKLEHTAPDLWLDAPGDLLSHM